MEWVAEVQRRGEGRRLGERGEAVAGSRGATGFEVEAQEDPAGVFGEIRALPGLAENLAFLLEKGLASAICTRKIGSIGDLFVGREKDVKGFVVGRSRDRALWDIANGRRGAEEKAALAELNDPALRKGRSEEASEALGSLLKNAEVGLAQRRGIKSRIGAAGSQEKEERGKGQEAKKPEERGRSKKHDLGFRHRGKRVVHRCSLLKKDRCFRRLASVSHPERRVTETREVAQARRQVRRHMICT